MLSGNTNLTGNALLREAAHILRDQLDLPDYPGLIGCDDTVDLMTGQYRMQVVWGDKKAEIRCDEEDLKLSLDDFSRRHILPLVAELCGLPLLDNGRAVINPVHDERIAA